MNHQKPYSLAHDGGWALRLHTSAVLILPLLATGIAVWEIVAGKVKAWEIALMLTMYCLTMLCISVGFHRFLCHRAFKTGPVLKTVLIIFGSMAAQGPVVYWVATHRRHHQFSDVDGDPHSPYWAGDRKATSGIQGLWHAQIGWLFGHRMSNTVALSSDMLRDRLVTWLSNRYYFWLIFGLALTAIVGALMEHSIAGALEGLVWGSGVRLFFSTHINYSVNSVSHMFGYRSFATRESSTNNPWLAIPSLGEHWHNNHHACPSSARFGLHWWEIDLGWIAILLLEKGGLVSDVVRPDAAILKKLRL